MKRELFTRMRMYNCIYIGYYPGKLGAHVDRFPRHEVCLSFAEHARKKKL